MIHAGGKKVPSVLEQAIMVMVSPFSVDVTVDTALDLFWQTCILDGYLAVDMSHPYSLSNRAIIYLIILHKDTFKKFKIYIDFRSIYGIGPSLENTF